MGCGASTETQQQVVGSQDGRKNGQTEHHVKSEGKEKKEKKRSDSSSSSDDSSSDEEDTGDPGDVITKTLLREYLEREINMLKLELTQPEVVLKQLLEQKDQATQRLLKSSVVLSEQRQRCMREYQDLTNLQRLIQQKHTVHQDTWDTEQKEYVEAYNKHKQVEEEHETLEKQSQSIDKKIKVASKDVRRLLKLRKKQDHILIKAFGGSYGSEKEASIEEYVDKMKEFRKNILNTKAQWKRGLEFTKMANTQYWRAVQVWTSIMKHKQPQVRWQFCAYVANYLHAAYTNSSQAVNCMKAHAQIPYFTPKMFQEVDTSRRNAYTACQDRFHATFLQWLWYYQQNAAYLERWIQKTLAQTIEGDLTKVNGYLTVAESDLRAERKRLILERVREKFGDEATSEVAEQEAEVERLSQEVSKMQSVSIQANVVTVTAGTDSGIESGDEEGPPPAPGSQSEENLTKHEEGSTELSVSLSPGDAGLGIEISGGNDSQTAPGDKGIYIVRLQPKGAAAKDSVLLSGDKILSVNGESFEDVSNEEAKKTLAQTGQNVVIVVVRNAPEAAKETNAAELRAAADAAAKLAEEESRKREEEELAAKAAEEESRRRLEEAKEKMAAIESATELLEAEKREAEQAAREAEEKRIAEEAAAAAQIAAEEAAAKAAVEQKEQMLLEAKQAAEAAEKAKAEAQKWTQMAEEAAKKAGMELEASKRAAEERMAAEREAQEAEDSARQAQEELDRIAAAAAAAKEEKERLARVAEEEKKKSEVEATQAKENDQVESQEDPAPNFQSDIDSIMNDYKSSVEQYNRKRGTEEARMDLDLQEKLRARRQRRRQQMKQKLQEQKLMAAQQTEDGDAGPK